MSLDLLMLVECDDIPIKGESLHKKLEGTPGAIDIRSWDYSVKQSALMGSQGKTAGKASFSDISITKPLDTATPGFFLACASGTVIKKVTIHGIKTADQNSSDIFYKVIMETVIISEITNTSVEHEENKEVLEILETVTFNPGKVSVVYAATNKTTQKLDAEKEVGWNIVTNSKA